MAQRKKQREREIQILSISEDLKADHKFAVRRIERNEESILISKKALDPDSTVTFKKIHYKIDSSIISLFLETTIPIKLYLLKPNSDQQCEFKKKDCKLYSVDYGLAYLGRL